MRFFSFRKLNRNVKKTKKNKIKTKKEIGRIKFSYTCAQLSSSLNGSNYSNRCICSVSFSRSQPHRIHTNTNIYNAHTIKAEAVWLVVSLIQQSNECVYASMVYNVCCRLSVLQHSASFASQWCCRYA